MELSDAEIEEIGRRAAEKAIAQLDEMARDGIREAREPWFRLRCLEKWTSIERAKAEASLEKS